MAADPSSLSSAEKQALLDAPALESPDGNYVFDNPPNDNTTFYAVMWVCVVPTTILFLVKAYARLFCAKFLRVEDYLGGVAFGLYLGFFVTTYKMSYIQGAFVHQWNYTLQNYIDFTYWGWLCTTLFFGSMLFLKAAILIEWTHIFSSHNRRFFYWTCYGLMSVHVTCSTILISVWLGHCTPIQRNWNPLLSGHCVPVKWIDITSAIFNLLVDVFILVLPQRVIWSLNMSTKKKMAISLIFASGLLACVFGSIRLGLIFWLYSSADITYRMYPPSLWGVGEISLGFVVFCLPSVPMAGSSVAKLPSALKSWVSSSSLRRGHKLSQTGKDSSGSRPIPKAYREIDEHALVQMSSTEEGWDARPRLAN
ncbi:hypothetical protein F4780DRAFT_630616 [Xylariomycetidae sp. FL0641]|nr:hypothetical protein F4780DRAFT_630616 [Xylariomycetidae sp. FL0641]